MNQVPIAYIEFAGGPMRPVFEENGRQFVIDDNGRRVDGVWFIPQEDAPIVVETGCSRSSGAGWERNP